MDEEMKIFLVVMIMLLAAKVGEQQAKLSAMKPEKVRQDVDRALQSNGRTGCLWGLALLIISAITVIVFAFYAVSRVTAMWPQ